MQSRGQRSLSNATAIRKAKSESAYLGTRGILYLAAGLPSNQQIEDNGNDCRIQLVIPIDRRLRFISRRVFHHILVAVAKRGDVSFGSREADPRRQHHRPLARQRGVDTRVRALGTSAVFFKRLSRPTSTTATFVLPKRNSKKVNGPRSAVLSGVMDHGESSF